MALTLEEVEILVKAVGNGHNSYADIKEALPQLSDERLKDAIGDSFKGRGLLCDIRLNRPIWLWFVKCPDDYTEDYIFKDLDRFELSIPGEDVFYQLRKEQLQNLKWLVSTIISVIAAIMAAISAIPVICAIR